MVSSVWKMSTFSCGFWVFAWSCIGDATYDIFSGDNGW